MTICNFDGCDRPTSHRGYCSKHYQRLRRRGLLPSMIAARGSVREWLLENVEYTSEDCLQFPFARTQFGRGCICFDGETLAHRWMCRAAHGAAPAGKPYALHSCGKGHLGCVNPRHLYWGTGVDNYRDQIRHGTAVRGERCGKPVLTEEIVLRIKDRQRQGQKATAIATALHVDREAVRSVLRGQAWSWL